MKARMKAATFDRKFDAGERITDQLDLAKARRQGLEAKRVNVDFPTLIKLWLADRLEQPR